MQHNGASVIDRSPHRARYRSTRAAGAIADVVRDMSRWGSASQ